MNLESWRESLDHLRRSGLLRSLRTVQSLQRDRVVLDGREVLLLCSNNYLGLADHPALVEAACRATEHYGAGSGGSRLISGTMTLHGLLEERLAAFKNTDAALLFNSGYAANTGILPGLMDEGDLIFSDRLNHAAIIDGCRLSRARTLVYPHRDTAALERLMAAQAATRRGRWLIVTDGVFSMDGDLAPLAELVRLKNRYDCLLMVDDAHGTGVLGTGGRGTGEHLGCLAGIDLHMGTLGKALGGFGAFVAGERVLIDTLINRARSLIFSTSLPPGVLAAALAALDLVEGCEGKRRRDRLRELRAAMVVGLDEPTGEGAEAVPIIPILTKEPGPTMRASAQLLEQGIFVQGIRPPTVPEGQCRLRATLMASHAMPDIVRAAAWIRTTIRENMP
jgi:glycine C-acetyltransferase/8-amino-7-oxononanoate synthase